MSGWGSMLWGAGPWGSGEDDDVESLIVTLIAINVLANDLLELVFNRDMKNDVVLQSVEAYTVVPLDPAHNPITVRRVHTGNNVRTPYVYLVVSPPSDNAYYDVTTSIVLRAADGDTPETPPTYRFLSRRTKIDSILSTRPTNYSLRSDALIRNLINAIGREDDRIGGSQDEGEEIVR